MSTRAARVLCRDFRLLLLSMVCYVGVGLVDVDIALLLRGREGFVGWGGGGVGEVVRLGDCFWFSCLWEKV